METPKVPDTARSEMSLIGESVVIKGELSCSEDLYIGGQVEGSIELKGNRLTVGPNGRVKGAACGQDDGLDPWTLSQGKPIRSKSSATV
jgi:cytoskeletal protein CcmA (bactofilin family)